MKSFHYCAISIPILSVAMWLSDYKYDWVLIIVGSLHGCLSALIPEESR